jgi:hypothetical protein
VNQIIVNGVRAQDEAEAWGMLVAAGVEPCVAMLDWNERTPVGAFIRYGDQTEAQMVCA